MAVTVAEMLKMSQEQLDNLFSKALPEKFRTAKPKGQRSSRRAPPTRRTSRIS